MVHHSASEKVVMLAFGAANRYWLTPRLLAAAKGGTLRLLCTSISVEILLGLVVLCVVAVLGELEPPGHMHHMDMNGLIQHEPRMKVHQWT